MNYIKAVNAFHNAIIFNPLSSSAVALWFALMHFNNKSGWKNNFTVPISQLQCHSGLKSTSFKRAREELRAKGLIVVTSRGANRAAQYRMVSQQMDCMNMDHDEQSVEPSDISQKSEPANEHVVHTSHPATGHIMDHTPDRTADPLLKQDQTQPNRDPKPAAGDEDASAMQFYQANFEAPAPFITSDIQTWICTSGDELVHHAMTIALERDKAN